MPTSLTPKGLLPWISLAIVGYVAAHAVTVEVLREGLGPPVSRVHKYNSMVTLYIENKNKSRTPSGWSTRKEDGAKEDQPFEFQPGVNLIEGWTEGVLQMKEGERALLHVPAAKGYGGRPTGKPGGQFYIPANSDLLFDIEILGKVGEVTLEVLQEGLGPPVSNAHKYNSMVTLYIENKDKSRTPSGWSTRKEDGADQDQPFEFQPGVNLIPGWTEGVLRMKEGERALLHVPAVKGYGRSPMGKPGGKFYIPANSNLLFDIEILGKAGEVEL